MKNTFLGEVLTGRDRGPVEMWETQVANLFWSVVFDIAHPGTRETEKVDAHTLPFLIRYRSGRSVRFDLLAFSNNYQGPAIRFFGDFLAERTSNFRDALRRISNAWKNINPMEEENQNPRENALRKALDGISQLPGHHLAEFAMDFVKKELPCEIILPPPPLRPHASVPEPPLGVATAAGSSRTSSVGIIAQNNKGEIGVTMAGHAIPLQEGQDYRGIPIWVDGQEGHIISSHMASDSAFVRLPPGLHFRTRPVRSRLQTWAPGLNQPLHFSGLATPGGETRTTATPLTLPLNDLGLQKYFMTELSTLPKDSGCACFDPYDNLAGFCWGGSGTQSAIAFSLWFWADSVFRAHKLQ
ncbi:MAG TPA: hypothetical protein VFE51_14085 [Verrucomicrobiae bacterium]|nr:hypothetical protein [Verrucomicrobiae bacterium]